MLLSLLSILITYLLSVIFETIMMIISNSIFSSTIQMSMFILPYLDPRRIMRLLSKSDSSFFVVLNYRCYRLEPQPHWRLIYMILFLFSILIIFFYIVLVEILLYCFSPRFKNDLFSYILSNQTFIDSKMHYSTRLQKKKKKNRIRQRNKIS